MSAPASAEITLFQNNGRGERPQVWIGKRLGATVHVQWGQAGGKLQATSTVHEIVNEGRKNERHPNQAAQDALDRLVKLKKREGYTEQEHTIAEQENAAKYVTLDFDDLPSNLCFYKPNKNVSVKMTKLMAGGGGIYTRKRDGEMFAIVVNNDRQVDIYSRRMHKHHDNETAEFPWSARFPHVVDAVLALNLPPKTVLLAEMIMNRNGADDFQHVTTVTRSLTPRALARQKSDGHLSAYVWDLAFFAGQPCASSHHVNYRLEWIKSRITGSKHLIPVETFNYDDAEAALQSAKVNGWEGFVVVDPEAVYEDRAWSFKGKPDRPSTCVKLKPHMEGDFLVNFDPADGVGSFGNGKKAGGVGAVACFAKRAGELVYVGDCGTGLTDEQVKSFAKAKYPQVWEIQFAEFTPKGMMRHAQFLRVRDDKTVDEIFEMPEAGEDE
jgi:ATP-dependent DNA ligase/predicted DNA-binding WGR domain protein